MAKRMFEIIDSKPLLAQWYISIDISTWLDEDEISNVDFSAKELESGDDATDEVLDSVKSLWDGTILKPYIKGGESGIIYRVRMDVTTVSDDKDVFWVDFTVKDEDE